MFNFPLRARGSSALAVVLAIACITSLLPLGSFVHAAANANVYEVDPTRFEILDGTKLPSDQSIANTFSARVTPGEYRPFSLLIKPGSSLTNVKLSWTDFSGSSGSLPSSLLDPYVVKVWYQAGFYSDDTNNKHLVQELLLKDDSLVAVDYSSQTNKLRVNGSGGSYYTDISSPSATFPSNVTVRDASSLQPFSMTDGRSKQLMLIAHVPSSASAGSYTSTLTISSDQGTVGTYTIRLTVLPFSLDESRLTYSLYYHGYLDDYLDRPFYFTNKTSTQMRLELQDMKEHGVLYPTVQQILPNLDGDLSLRNQVGLPKDKIFPIVLTTGNPTSADGLNSLKDQVRQWQNKVSQYGYSQLYVYGIDEARGEQLRSQRPAWQAVHDVGSKVFVAGYYETYDDMGDLLDVAVIQQALQPSQAQKYHSKGHQIYSYSNPQVGQENAEVYRRNFGLALWKAGYDGAMNYAYQKSYGNSIWNDFDAPGHYREETFTYPATDSLISTIQWEGWRQGVTDVRYLSTLLNEIDRKKSQGNNVSSYEQWVNAIDPSGDLDSLRDQIADKIMELRGAAPVQESPLPTPTPVISTPPVGGPLPASWQHKDVGSVSYQGSASYADGLYGIRGSGADIWDYEDAFHFAYQRLQGNGSITARVDSLSASEPWAKAGIMLRQDLDADSPHAMAVVTPSKGVHFQGREVEGGMSFSDTANDTAQAPAWMKLTREGDRITMYTSLNGYSWGMVSAHTIPMSQSIYVGLYVTAHTNDEIGSATISNVTIQQAPIPTPTPTPVIPTPTPVIPSPTPVIPSPTPVIPTPTPVIPSPTPIIHPTPTPVIPTPTPVIPSPTPVIHPTPTPVIPTPTPVIPSPTPIVRPTPTPIVAPSPIIWPNPTPIIHPTPTPAISHGPSARPSPTPSSMPIVQPPAGGGSGTSFGWLMQFIMGRLKTLGVSTPAITASPLPSNQTSPSYKPSPAVITPPAEVPNIFEYPAATSMPAPTITTRPRPSPYKLPTAEPWVVPWFDGASANPMQQQAPAVDPVSAQLQTGGFVRNLGVGSQGSDVISLQKFLNARGFAVADSGPGSAGNESSFFGTKTKIALARFQASAGITPADGFFGPLTRSYVAKQAR